MAAPKAAGVEAGGTIKHALNLTEEQAAKITPELFDKLIELAYGQDDRRALEREGWERYQRDMANSLPLTQAQLDGLAKLREPFPESAIAKRPQINCTDCKDARGKACEKHPKTTCPECKQYVSPKHKHLDYVGHAELTDRLLEVDPTWDWEPMAVDAHGLPLLDHFGGMWIRLTVCGLTRKGYGDAVGKAATTTAMKEIIGDALRNAAMRFGAALDLWAATNLHEEEPHPGEQYLDRLRDPMVWKSAVYLAGVRSEADEAGQLEYAVPNGGGRTLAEVIDDRMATVDRLEMEYMQEKARADSEREAAKAEADARRAQQPPASEPPADDPGQDPGEGTDQVADAIMAGLRVKAGNGWQNATACQQTLTEAQTKGLANMPAHADQPDGQTFGQLLRERIQALREQGGQGATGTAGASRAAGAGGSRRRNPQDGAA